MYLFTQSILTVQERADIWQNNDNNYNSLEIYVVS